MNTIIGLLVLAAVLVTAFLLSEKRKKGRDQAKQEKKKMAEYGIQIDGKTVDYSKALYLRKAFIENQSIKYSARDNLVIGKEEPIKSMYGIEVNGVQINSTSLLTLKERKIVTGRLDIKPNEFYFIRPNSDFTLKMDSVEYEKSHGYKHNTATGEKYYDLNGGSLEVVVFAANQARNDQYGYFDELNLNGYAPINYKLRKTKIDESLDPGWNNGSAGTIGLDNGEFISVNILDIFQNADIGDDDIVTLTLLKYPQPKSINITHIGDNNFAYKDDFYIVSFA